MSKKDNSPAISFFSFQDIITSVTGIMFLVVIMILLMLFQNKPTTPQEEKEEEPSQEVQNIREQIAIAKARIAELSLLKDNMDKLIAEYQKLSPEKLEEMVQQLSADLADLNAEKRQLAEQVIQMQETIVEIQSNTENVKRQRQDIQKDVDVTQKNISVNDIKINDLQKKYNIARQTVVFSIPKGDGRLPFLVECGKDGIQVLDWVNGKLIDLQQPGQDDNRKMAAFLQWLETQNLSDASYTLILKPCTLNYGVPLVNEMKKRGAVRGLDFLPEDTLTLTTAFKTEKEEGK